MNEPQASRPGSGVLALCLAAGIALIGTASTYGQSNDVARIYHRAQQLAEDGNVTSAERIKLLSSAASQGEPHACDDLGALYEVGLGVPKSFPEAFRLYSVASEAGLASGQNHLGAAYANGKGTETNLAKAFALFQKAAGQGLAEAEFNLGQFYREGSGVETNFPQAVHWFTLAAQQNNVASMINLAGLYAEGRGVPRDPVEAYKWLTVAIRHGATLATKNRVALSFQMSPEEIVAARKRVDAFMATNASPSASHPSKP